MITEPRGRPKRREIPPKDYERGEALGALKKKAPSGCSADAELSAALAHIVLLLSASSTFLICWVSLIHAIRLTSLISLISLMHPVSLICCHWPRTRICHGFVPGSGSCRGEQFGVGQGPSRAAP